MKVGVIRCGPTANESEEKAIAQIREGLISVPSDDQWFLLTNLAFSMDPRFQSDEIDILVIGPPGVRVVEIKHWAAKWMNAYPAEVERASELLTAKAKRVGGNLRKIVPNLPKVTGAFLLTHETAAKARLAGSAVRGNEVRTLKNWGSAISLDAPGSLTPDKVDRLMDELRPKNMPAPDGSLRRFAGYTNLELQSPGSDRFHRIYKGSHPSRRDKVIIHLYDLSADEKNAETKASREFEALHRLQQYTWAPRIQDSFQAVAGYEGEMSFFSIIDPAAPSIEERRDDKGWTTEGRLAFAREVVQALKTFHASGFDNEPLLHRNITPASILVKFDNSPILTGFKQARIPTYQSVATTNLATGTYSDTVAPEVQSQGLSAADPRSDIYSLCACLNYLFQSRSDDKSREAVALFARGITDRPEKRISLEDLTAGLAKLLGEVEPLPQRPLARFWSEGQIVEFRDQKYRILSRLGNGGVGMTFKVIEMDRDSNEDLNIFVAKVVSDKDIANRVLRAYRKVRAHLRHSALSTIFEVASTEWHENEFSALMTWIEGTPLSDYIGVFPLLVEEPLYDATSAEELAVRWMKEICEGLGVLHRNQLVHGDVSPRNIITSNSGPVLTDYDFCVGINEPLASPGTVPYASPSYRDGLNAQPSDDIYALATSFFHVVFDREPFLYGGNRDKGRGLNWEGIDRETYPILAPFLDRATNPDRTLRFASTAEALAALTPGNPAPEATDTADTGTPMIDPLPDPPVLLKQQLPWLRSLLQAYPGSRWGNSETRGLDSEFAAQTYVETALEKSLLEDVRRGDVRLVVLCGNAGDGKTALLQHLADQLGLGHHHSSMRILEGNVKADGPHVRMNLDGSASLGERSADELLDEFLEPFLKGPPAENIVHLLAINDGRLLEWIERRDPMGEIPLTGDLYALLRGEVAPQSSHIRFISLNERSLVGGIQTDRTGLNTAFLEELIDQLYGGERASEIWSVCHTCQAQEHCKAFQTSRVFGPDTLHSLVDKETRSRARQRLIEALQAVHLGGETHITVRELRAALVYILFGVHYCDDYHDGVEAPPYWDRAFMADSINRQGDLLAELARYDPALEVHPRIDRYLVGARDVNDREAAPRYPDDTLEPERQIDSARRRAYFEWTEANLEAVGGARDALGLARGRHLERFRRLPLMSEDELAEERRQICQGISRLEDLPPQALDRLGVAPLRVTPRTPTETAFWVEKPLTAFRLEVDLPELAPGVEALHRQAYLTYTYRDGRQQDRLRIGAELFHQLLELAEGYQLGDVSTDDTFANLSIFVQRLVREDERELLAWNPMQDEQIYRVAAERDATGAHVRQLLRLEPL